MSSAQGNFKAVHRQGQMRIILDSTDLITSKEAAIAKIKNRKASHKDRMKKPGFKGTETLKQWVLRTQARE